MKRIHLFEFEDESWFPNWLRIRMTRMIVVVHRFMGTADTLSELMSKLLKRTQSSRIIDLCSGSGGPMLKALEQIREQPELQNTQITLR